MTKEHKQKEYLPPASPILSDTADRPLSIYDGTTKTIQLPKRASILKLVKKDSLKDKMKIMESKIPQSSYEPKDTSINLHTLFIKLHQLKKEFKAAKPKDLEHIHILIFLDQLENLHDSVSNVLFSIPYLKDQENIALAHKALKNIDAFQIELNRKIPKLDKNTFSLDIKILIALFLDICEFMKYSDPVVCIFFPMVLPSHPIHSAAFIEADVHKHRWATFWKSRTNTTFSIEEFTPKEDKKEIGFAYFQKHYKIYRSLKKYYEITNQETHPFKNIQDIQKFLIAVEQGNIVLLSSNYSHLGYQEIENILPLEYNPIKIANRRLKETQDTKYETILEVFGKMLLAEYKRKTTFSLSTETVHYDNTRKIVISQLIQGSQQKLLDAAGISIDYLIEHLRNSTSRYAILSGNLKFYQALMDAGLPIDLFIFPAKIRPLFFAIQKRQFEIAKSILDAFVRKTTATTEILRTQFLFYIDEHIFLSEDIFSALLEFMKYYGGCNELIPFFTEYQSCYQEFIACIFSKDANIIKNTLDKLETSLKKYGDDINSILSDWINSRYHEALYGGSIIEFLVFLPPKIAFDCLQPFLKLPQKYIFASDFNNISREVHFNLFIKLYKSLHIINMKHLVETLSTISDDPTCISTIEIAAQLAYQYKDTCFIDLMIKQGVDKKYLSENQKNMLLLMALKENNPEQIKFAFSLDAKISQALTLAVSKDNNNDSNFITLACLNNYLDYCCQNKKPEGKIDLHSIKDRLLNDSLFQLKDDVYCSSSRPIIFLAIKSKNLKLVEALFHAGMLLNPKPLSSVKNYFNPLVYSLERGDMEMTLLLIKLGQKKDDPTQNVFPLRGTDQIKLRICYEVAVLKKDFYHAEILRNFLKHARIEFVLDKNNLFNFMRIDISDIEKRYIEALKVSTSVQTSSLPYGQSAVHFPFSSFSMSERTAVTVASDDKSMPELPRSATSLRGTTPFQRGNFKK